MSPPAHGFRSFVVLWSGQFASLTGSGVSGFALGVYAYQLSGSVTVLGLIYALAYLPMILVSPFAGSLVDRWGPRKAMTVSVVAAALIMLGLAGLLASGAFVVWHLFVVVSLLSVVSALQLPAFESTVPRLVPQRHLGRANGMRMLAMATSQVLAPVAAGFLLLAVGIDGIILIDCASYAFALLGLAIVRIPHTGGERSTAGGPRSLLADFAEAWHYVAARRGLVSLMLFLGALNFFAGFADLLITPLVLAFASPDALGTVISVGGLGMIGASLAVSAWGGPKHRVRGVLGFSVVIGLAMVLGSLRPDVVLITAGAAVLLGALAVVVSSNQAIWQTKVEPAMLGRTMALLNMVASAPQLVAYCTAGVLTDLVFQPLVGRDEVASPVFAALVGTGPGRGIALLLMVMGVLIIGVVALAWSDPRLRRLEEELPDMTDETAMTDETGTTDGTPQQEPATGVAATPRPAS
jgi:hypothetical protein